MFRRLKDPISGLTHSIGAVLSVVGLSLLLSEAINPLRPWHLITYFVFGFGMTLLYTASTLYHWLPLNPAGTRCLRKLDHMMIFVMIAATYTPICLIPLRGPWGWSLFGSVWGLAALGMFMKLYWFGAPRWFSTLFYAVMGWLVLVGIWPIFQTLQRPALLWLVIGGGFYTIGALIYAFKKPNPWPGWFGFHEIFHILVMLGSFSHFWLMYRYVAEFN